MASPRVSDLLLPAGLQQATSFELYRCPSCPHIHFVLTDQDGDPMSEVVISNEQAIAIGLEGERGKSGQGVPS